MNRKEDDIYRRIHLNDHLPDVILSYPSFAIDRSIQMIICKSQVIQMIIRKRPVDQDDHLREVGLS